jgi:hypothetical protein
MTTRREFLTRAGAIVGAVALAPAAMHAAPTPHGSAEIDPTRAAARFLATHPEIRDLLTRAPAEPQYPDAEIGEASVRLVSVIRADGIALEWCELPTGMLGLVLHGRGTACIVGHASHATNADELCSLLVAWARVTLYPVPPSGMAVVWAHPGAAAGDPHALTADAFARAVFAACGRVAA